MRLHPHLALLIALTATTSFADADPSLINAAKNKDVQAVRALLKQRVDVNTQAPDGATALSWSVYWDDLTAVDLLIRARANVNTANNYGVTPLWLACGNRNAVMVEKLLDAGAAPDAARSGETALMRCARTGSLEGVKALLARGADVNAQESLNGQTGLMWAVAEGHFDVARVLIDKGAKVNARSKGGFSPLLFAARSGDLESARALVDAGANVNDVTPDGLSVLLVASASGHEAVSVLLVEKGADPNVIDSCGITPLHYAVLKGLSVIRGVVPLDGTPNLLRSNMPELVKALLAHGANPNAPVSKELKQHTPAPCFPFSRQYARTRGASPFLLAAGSFDPVIMRLLVAAGADPLQATDVGLTPLMAAAGVGQIYGNRTKADTAHALEAVKLAVELGADVNAADWKGWTALHGAAYRGANDIIQFLVDKGARLDVMDKYGHTPLIIASGDENVLRDERERRNYPDTAALIRKLGGDTLATGWELTFDPNPVFRRSVSPGP